VELKELAEEAAAQATKQLGARFPKQDSHGATVRGEMPRRGFHSLMKQLRVHFSLVIKLRQPEPITTHGVSPRHGVQGKPATNSPQIETPGELLATKLRKH
jgi:hypothetical protein